MKHRPLELTAAIALLGALAHNAGAGAPVSENRSVSLPSLCRGGPDQGKSCTSDGDCARAGRCRPVFLHGKPPPVRLTLVVDDDVSAFDGSETLANVVAVTAVLEARRGHQRRLFAQTYQNLDGSSFEALVDGLTSGVPVADLATRDRVLTEAALNAAVLDGGILDDFLFQEGDSELADALREFYGVAGRPVGGQVTAGPATFVHTDEEASGRASAIQLLLAIRFAPAT